MTAPFPPLFELTRGRVVESVHFGAIAVVDAEGKLLASWGDPHTVAFLRSSAKPFQALPFFERGGPAAFGLDLRERALICASHEGSDTHLRTAESLQRKTGIRERDLQCGIHMPGDPVAYRALIARGESPTPNRNNCSGKHTAMLAHAKMRGLPLDSYLELGHPVQQDILKALAEICDYPEDKIELGIDGCSAPNFAVPLYNAALAFARLCDPTDLAVSRASALRAITQAMTGEPEMISGPREFDCRLMQAGRGLIISKRGAEGYQALGLAPDAIKGKTRGVGVAMKVSDGDLLFRGLDLEPQNRVRPAVALEILRQLGALDMFQLESLSEFGPSLPVTNHRGREVGGSRPVFRLSTQN
jgi:L-asparaginase II